MTVQLVSAISNRDGAALAKMAGGRHEPEKVISSEAEQLVDSLFRQLKQIFPAAISTSLKTESDEKTTKRQWIAAFAENGIRSKQQLSAGMRQARASDSPFLPSPGQFIEWCKTAETRMAGLPDVDELYEMVMRYCAERGRYTTAEEYPWQSDACYWLVTGLCSVMRAQGLSEAELRIRCRAELKKMALRIQRGEAIPAPVAQIQELHCPVSNEKGLNKIAELRERFGLNRQQ